MKVVTGTEKLSTVIEGIKRVLALDIIYARDIKFKIEDKIIPEFHTILLKKPIIFYAKKGSLNGSHYHAEFLNYSDYIYYAENMETLRYFKSLSEDIQKKLEINWVIIDVDEDIRKSSWLDKLILLDFWQIEREKKNTTGNIDYLEIEAAFKDLSYEKFARSFMKKFIKYITYPLLGIKPPQFGYVYPKLRYIKTPMDIVITKNMNNQVYRYCCCICGMKHSIVLSDSKKTRMQNSTNVILFNEKNKCIEFKCNHENTEYEGMRQPYFRPEKIGGYILKEKHDYDKAFLYLFERYKKDGENINLMNENEEIKSFKIINILKRNE